MTAAEQIQKSMQAAYDADRALTAAEFQSARDAINDPGTPVALRGALRALGDALSRQADARRERVRAAEEQERGRLRLLALEDREQKWQQLDSTAAALFSAMAERPTDATLRTLAKHLLRTDQRGPAPQTWMNELLPEHERLPGFFGFSG